MGPASQHQGFVQGKAGRLSITTCAPSQGQPRADLLFIHGAWSSSWYWEEHFLPWFAAQGYRARAVTLRGHGVSEGRVRWASVAGYVDDVARATADLTNPVLIGHSMGGFIAQQFAAHRKVRGLALIASVPPFGAWQSLYRIARDMPLALLRCFATLDLYPVVADPAKARSLLYSLGPGQTEKDHLLAQLKSESFRAFLDMLFLPVRHRPPPELPVLVMGAGQDRIIPAAAIAGTARFHGVSPVILPEASHMVPVDEGWLTAATALEDWIAGTVLASPDQTA
ncbi:MAG: lysophospholipase [Tabrizicola sp.]|jgi:pimeloyl-ACP methyl ester carboxylesterase|nr:lysophospholipase [Tabrizicola sp.]